MVFIFRQHKTHRYTCRDLTPRQRVYRPLVSGFLTVSQIDDDNALIPCGFLQPQGNGENVVWDANEKPHTEREKETDKEWTGLDGVVTHTDCYIHIYNRVRSDRLHLNLHLFYSFCRSLFSLFLCFFLSLSQPLGFLLYFLHSSDWPLRCFSALWLDENSLSPSRSPTFSSFSHNAHGWWAGAKGLSNHFLSHQSKLTGPSDMKRNLSSSH